MRRRRSPGIAAAERGIDEEGENGEKKLTRPTEMGWVRELLRVVRVVGVEGVRSRPRSQRTARAN